MRFLDFKKILYFELSEGIIKLYSRENLEETISFKEIKENPDFIFATVSEIHIENALKGVEKYMLNQKILDMTMIHLRRVKKLFSEKATGFEKKTFQTMIDKFYEICKNNLKESKIYKIKNGNSIMCMLSKIGKNELIKCSKLHEQYNFKMLTDVIMEEDLYNAKYMIQTIATFYYEDSLNEKTAFKEMKKLKKISKEVENGKFS